MFKILNNQYTFNKCTTLNEQMDITGHPDFDLEHQGQYEHQVKYSFYYAHVFKDKNVQFKRESTIYQNSTIKKYKTFVFTNRELYQFNRMIKPIVIEDKEVFNEDLYLAFAGKKYTNGKNMEPYIDDLGASQSIATLLNKGNLLVCEIDEEHNIEYPVAIIPSNVIFYIDSDSKEIFTFKLQNKETYLANYVRTLDDLVNNTKSSNPTKRGCWEADIGHTYNILL